MGNVIKRKLALGRFYKEILKCPFDREQMNIQAFEAEVNSLLNKTKVYIGALLCEAVFTNGTLIVYPDVEASNEQRLVFNDLFQEYERYELVEGCISKLSERCSLDVNRINEENKEALNKAWEFYQKVYELLGTMRSIPLTDNLSFDYGFSSDCHYAVRDRFGNVSEIREIDDEYKRQSDTATKFYVNRGLPIATIDYRHMHEICAIKKEIENLWETIKPDKEEDRGVFEVPEEIKLTMLK